jgi:hypothetical protein
MVQVLIDLLAIIAGTVLWLKLRRPPQDDPRLSRGLALLQSKISVLEDLSDRTDAQVKQLTSLIEQKARLLQNKIIEAEHQILRVDQSMRKSKEVAEIFQDRIPHEEIIERQQTVKYVKAAQMAHAGQSIEEIAQAVDLPTSQIELVSKLNKNNLVFDPEALPEWAKSDVTLPTTTQEFAASVPSTTPSFAPAPEYASLKRLGEEFRQACDQFPKSTAVNVISRPTDNTTP